MEAAPARVVTADRPSGAIKVWAGAGIVGVAIALQAWVRWIASGDPHQPDTLGPDQPSTAAMIVLRTTEVAAFSLFLFLAWWSLIRPWMRERRIGLDGKIFIGGFFAAACDVMISFFNPTWTFNAKAISLGTWADYFPLYGSPGQGDLPWGTLWCLAAYIFLGLGAALVGSAVLRFLRPRLPRLSRAGLFATVLAVFYAIAFCLELVWIRGDVYNYVSVPSELTLWAGTTHQLPVYSPLLLGLYGLAFTVLRESRDDRGRSFVDRDVDDLRAGPNAKTVVSTLAVCGYAFIATLIAYQIPWSWLAMRGDTAPTLPSYMRDGVYCGQPGQPLCAGQYLDRLRADDNGR
jgi:hypothetical protein